MAWCKNMDLLAVATQDDKLVVHRLSWQKLWEVELDPPEDGPVDSAGNALSSITALAWRPDGKLIAVGQSHGGITLFEVEDGKKVSSCQYHAGSISTMAWFESTLSTVNELDYVRTNVSNKTGVQDRTPLYCTPLNAVPQPLSQMTTFFSGASEASKKLPPRPLDSPAAFNVLVSGDQHGRIAISALGTCLVGLLETRTCWLPPSSSSSLSSSLSSSSLLPASIATSFSSSSSPASLLQTPRKEGASSSSSGGVLNSMVPCRPQVVNVLFDKQLSCLSAVVLDLHTQQTHLLTFRTHVYALRLREVALVASQCNNITCLMTYIDNTLSAMNTTWKNGRGGVSRKVDLSFFLLLVFFLLLFLSVVPLVLFRFF